MNDRPRNMDEFAAGMREAAAAKYILEVDRAKTLGGTMSATEAAIAYVREQFEFAPMREKRCRGGERRGVSSMKPILHYLYPDDCRDEGRPLNILVPKSAPEPEPPPDAVREAAENAREVLTMWLDRPAGPSIEAIKLARAELDAALNAE